MALIAQGGMAPTVSGKIGNTVFARNRGGAYVRNYVKPVNPQTSRQSFVRAVFGGLSAFWKTLNQATRDSFQAFAVNNPVPNRVGLTTTLPGLAQFQAINGPRLLVGLSTITTPPPQPLQVDWHGDQLEANDLANGTFRFEYDNSSAWTADGGALLFFISPPQSLGTNFYKGVYGQQEQVMGGGATTGSLTVTPAIATPTGQTNRYFFRAYPTFPSGNLGSPVTGSVDVTNP